MPTWMTAEQISTRLVVGAQRLLEYAKRGNLAMYRLEDGTVFFDGDAAANYFRPRNAVLQVDPDARDLGVMGKVRLGEGHTTPASTGLSGREARKRELRLSGATLHIRQVLAKTG